MPRNPRPHLMLPEIFTSTKRYQYPGRGGNPYATPERNRARQASILRQNLSDIQRDYEEMLDLQREHGWADGFGITVLFSSFPDIELAVDSLEQRASGIELLSVRDIDGRTLAAVWIPDGKLSHFEDKISDYLRRAPRDNQKLVDAIQSIRSAVLEDLWTDEAPLPMDSEVIRFEAWLGLPVKKYRNPELYAQLKELRVSRFRAACEAQGLRVGQSVLAFPERLVLQVVGSIAQMRASAAVLGQLAELRYAPESAEFFIELPTNEQADWSENLIARASFPDEGADVPYICILDTGVSRAHPLISPLLSMRDMHTADPAWGNNDDHGHGTEQSGLAIWGDLTNCLVRNDFVTIGHRLESVKIQPRDGFNGDDHLASITVQAVSRPEIQYPSRSRLFSMAVTSTRTTISGRATAWSSEIDSLTSDWLENGRNPRLMIVSGGNVHHTQSGHYFGLNSGTSIEDPAQSWNSLTVGAITEKYEITEDQMRHYFPMAPAGGLSPFCSTSAGWNREFPFKPDVVFEGGNLASDGDFVSRADSLSLLTTYHLPLQRTFVNTEATSAATALGSHFSAQVMAKYPSLWPQTVRALIVHSADWTDELLRQFPGNGRDQIEFRLRHCGWGRPDISKALNSGSDSLTLLLQSGLQPFEKKPVQVVGGARRGGNITSRDMQMHKIPWPTAALQDLLDQEVELRITLSYFVEPNPGERGRTARFSYASHGLRFALQRPTESVEQFQNRINLLSRDAESELDLVEAGDENWMLGARRRFRGSLHHDRLRCSAADLAGRQYVAVFPVGGWWKTREAQGRFTSFSKYSLVISIASPEIPVDIDLTD
ncbi:hypothetical protein XTPLMG730_3711 [Xanthomonas translucens pv. phlei]|uniref:Peptidase S8/S53 domain-containing protein n=1 Tax=Xanthomonas graminis pv. phlei TaxID=487906 RepID=A0A0K3A5E1_9XANT|nr:hypothetical protein XTPLMG730_3711 [Xanthomonas translucens pv. phlei]